MIYPIIPVAAFMQLTESRKVLALDTRPTNDYVDGFIPLSLNVPLQSEEARELVNVFAPETPVIIICDQDKIQESIAYVKNLGYPFIEGTLEGGFAGWQKAENPIDLMITVEADELAMDIPHDENLLIIDVRTAVEFAEGHIEDAQSLPLMDLHDPAGIALLPENANLYFHCTNMVRSNLAAGIFKQHGLHNLRVISSSWDDLKNTSGIVMEKKKAVANKNPKEEID